MSAPRSSSRTPRTARKSSSRFFAPCATRRTAPDPAALPGSVASATARAARVRGTGTTDRCAWRVTPRDSVTAATHRAAGRCARAETRDERGDDGSSGDRRSSGEGSDADPSGGGARASTRVPSSTETRARASPVGTAPWWIPHVTTSPSSVPIQTAAPLAANATALATKGPDRAPGWSRSANPPTPAFRSARATTRSA